MQFIRHCKLILPGGHYAKYMCLALESGVGSKMLDLFRKYMDAYPPDPPTEQELRADSMVTRCKLNR